MNDITTMLTKVSKNMKFFLNQSILLVHSSVLCVLRGLRVWSFRVAFFALSLLTLVRVDADSLTESLSGQEVILTGEIRLEGRIQSISPTDLSLVLQVSSFTLPNGKTDVIPSPRPKTVLLSPASQIHVRGDTKQKLALSTLKPGVFAIAIGKDLGSGKELPARQVAVWDRVDSGRFHFASQRTEVTQPPQPRGVPPACRFVRPKPDETIAGQSVRVLVEATDDKDIVGVRFYVNNFPVPDMTARPIIAGIKPIPAGIRPIVIGSKDTTAQHKISRHITADLALPAGDPEIAIRAVVVDAEQNTGEALVNIRSSGSLPLGDLYVLSVGISRYRNESYDLECAARDARAMANILAQQKGKQYRQVHTALLTDERATLESIRQALGNLKAAKSGDTVMVFLFGHGLDNGEKLFFATHGLVVNETEIERSSLGWQEVAESLSAVSAKKLLFVDAYHPNTKLGPRQATSKQLLEAIHRRGGIAMVSASSEGFSEPGIFAGALVETFQGKADLDQDGRITLPELHLYLTRRVAEVTKNNQKPDLVSVQDFSPQTALARVN